jgi:hypothetical protein
MRQRRSALRLGLVHSSRSATDDAAVPPGGAFRGVPASAPRGLRCAATRAGWAPVSTPRLLSVAARRVARVGQPRAAAGPPSRECCRGGLDPAEAAATWPPALRRPVKAQHCSLDSCAAVVLAPPRAVAGRPRARTGRSTQRVPMPSRQLWRPCAPAASRSCSHRRTTC